MFVYYLIAKVIGSFSFSENAYNLLSETCFISKIKTFIA